MTCGRFSVGSEGVLMPMDEAATELCREVGAVLDVEILFDRDMHYHRRVFSAMRELAQALGQSPDFIRAQLLTYCGLFNIVGTLDGLHMIAVNSVSRRGMRDEEFHQFWNEAQEHIVERVLPKINDEAVRERLRHVIQF
jgi:hypothetical protein